MNKIDLHIHSSYSDDGEFSPAQLISMAKQSGIKVLALSDHNTTKGIDEAMKQAKEEGVALIPSTEIDCVYKDVNFHVLGLGIKYDMEVFDVFGENLVKQELAFCDKRLELVNRLGFDLTRQQVDLLSKNGVYTGELFAEILLNDERYNENELLAPYRPGGMRGNNPYVNFYWDYFSQGKPCYVELSLPSLEHAVKTIRKHGGLAILAHPGNNLKNHLFLTDELLDLVDGVECFSSYHSAETNDYFYNIAINKGLAITCGSDFHGKTKPSIKMGDHGFCDELKILNELKRHDLINTALSLNL